jgi:DNA invertase Pin-like site-specific DNA recombinase
MSESGKITASHLSRTAVIYVRQSTLVQVERNTESTARQYDLVNRARRLGWPREAIRVIDGDLGISGSVTGQRDGFEGMVAEIALGQVGIILALEASRLARDNAAWYRLLDLAGVCDTLVADADGVYHPALFNDRLVLGMKGIMSEAELHVLRARLEGGIKNKAARGELRRGLPVGLVWGEADGEICFHPDEAVTGVITAVFGQFAACGSVRATWLWLRGQRLRWPLQKVAYTRRGSGIPEVTWVDPTYHAVHTTLTHPAYAGAYVYGRTRKERYLDPGGALRQRSRRLPRDQWEVLIPDHHPGFTDWDTYLANQAPHRRQHPAAGQPAGHRRGPGRMRAAAGPGHLRQMRPQARDLLCRPGQMRAELLLPGIRRAGRRARRPAHERRRAGHRRRRRGRVPGRAGARRAGCVPASRPPARRRPRRRAGPAPAPGGAGPLPRGQGRTPLPGGRPR